LQKILFMSTQIRPVVYWLFAGCLLVYLMVVVGAITRLTHSGLSMTDWSPTGSLPPLNEIAWTAEFNKYQSSPEYKIMNSHFTLSEFKSIFWWEYIHRFIGRFIGIVFFIGFIYFLIRKKLDIALIKRCIILMFLGALQGVIGWWMVKSGLSKNPAVSHYRLAVHLMNAFLVFGVTFWFALELIYKQTTIVKVNQNFSAFKRIVYVFFAVLILQIIYGAFVAGLKAGLAFPTWPKMGENWIAPEVNAFDSFFENFIDKNKAGIQFIHRYIAYLVVAMVAWVYFKSKQVTVQGHLKNGIQLLLAATGMQFLLGVLTLIYHVPVVLGVLHQTGAFIMYAVSIFILFQIHKIHKRI
jgi:heme a synthase